MRGREFGPLRKIAFLIKKNSFFPRRLKKSSDGHKARGKGTGDWGDKALVAGRLEKYVLFAASLYRSWFRPDPDSQPYPSGTLDRLFMLAYLNLLEKKLRIIFLL